MIKVIYQPGGEDRLVSSNPANPSPHSYLKGVQINAVLRIWSHFFGSSFENSDPDPTEIFQINFEYTICIPFLIWFKHLVTLKIKIKNNLAETVFQTIL